MRLFVFASEVLQADVRVFLCGGETRVSQQFLDAAEISAPFQKMRGKTVTERVRRYPAPGGQCQTKTRDQSLYVARVQPFPVDAHENRLIPVCFPSR